jgi:hypothetical protein
MKLQECAACTFLNARHNQPFHSAASSMPAWLMPNTAMCCAALLLQVIMRIGKWLKEAMYVNCLAFFKTEGLMAMGCWPHAGKEFVKSLINY